MKLFNLDNPDDVLKHTQEQKEEMFKELAEEEQPSNFDTMFEEVKSEVSKGMGKGNNKKDHFVVTGKKSKHTLDITGTGLQPVAGTGDFHTRYKKQVEALVFCSKTNFNTDDLIPILQCMAIIREMKGTSAKIKVVCGGYHTNGLTKIAKVLNEVFKEQYYVIESMYVMFNNTIYAGEF